MKCNFILLKFPGIAYLLIFKERSSCLDQDILACAVLSIIDYDLHLVTFHLVKSICSPLGLEVQSLPVDQKVRFLALLWDFSLMENYSVVCMDRMSVAFPLPYL